MEVDYKKNFIGSNDPSFQYDKRVDFSANKKNDVTDSWDEDEDDYEEDFVNEFDDNY